MWLYSRVALVHINVRTDEFWKGEFVESYDFGGVF